MRTMVLPILFIAACGSDTISGGDGPTAQDLSSSPDLLPGSTDLASVYPSPPYGNTVGDTFPVLYWEGYRDDLADAVATTKPYVASYTSNDLHSSGKKYALVHISEFY